MAAVAPHSASPVPLPGSHVTDRMLTFETAKLATEHGDDRLRVQLLEELVGEAEADRFLLMTLFQQRSSGSWHE